MRSVERLGDRERSDRHGRSGLGLCGGAAGAGTWGRVTSGTFRRSGAPEADPGVSRERCSGRRRRTETAEPGTSEIRRECWSRGRIVSALLACAPGGCHPSLVPPNPVPSRLLRCPRLARGAVPLDIALDLRQWGFMNRASQGPLRVGQLTEATVFGPRRVKWYPHGRPAACLLYTSDAADE